MYIISIWDYDVRWWKWMPDNTWKFEVCMWSYTIMGDDDLFAYLFFFACAPQGKIPELAKCAIFFKTEKLQQIWHEHRSRVVLCALKHQTGQAPPWWAPQFVSGGRTLRIKNRFCHWTRPSLRAELAMNMSLQQMDLGLTVSKQQCETCDLHCSRFLVQVIYFASCHLEGAPGEGRTRLTQLRTHGWSGWRLCLVSGLGPNHLFCDKHLGMDISRKRH